MSGETIGLDFTSSAQANAPITNSPIVRMVHPPSPEACVRQIATMWLAAHHVDPLWIVEGGRKYPGSFDPDHEQVNELSREKLQEMIWNEVIPVPAWQTVLECVRFTFVVYNMSRAAQQQLTRQRLGVGFNNNSLRVIKLETFAVDRRYRMPPSFDDGGELANEFHQAMIGIQDDYAQLLAVGVKQEDARGIMPLNIHSPTVTFFADLRALRGFISKRLCHEAQDEMNEFAVYLKREVDAWDHWFGSLLSFPCSRDKECVIGPDAANRCPLPYPWKGGENKGIVITSYKEE